MKLPFVPSAANFILVNVGDGAENFPRVAQRRIIVRALKGYNLAAVGSHFSRHDGTKPAMYRALREIRRPCVTEDRSAVSRPPERR